MGKQVQQQPSRTLIFNWEKEFSRDTLTFIQQRIDLRPSTIKRWKKRKDFEALRDDQKYSSCYYVIITSTCVIVILEDILYKAALDSDTKETYFSYLCVIMIILEL